MNPLTGGCHYSQGCRQFETGCGHCPQLSAAAADDISAFSFEHKQRALSKLQFDIVAPSAWMLNEAQASGIFPARTRWHQIRYGLDTQAFRPLDKAQAKSQLKLRTDRPLIVFAADHLSDPRKGMVQLEQALAKMPANVEFDIAFFGNGELPSSLQRAEVHRLGYLSTDEEKRVAYSAADCFVLPSLQDNQPQTGLEALACGTPVVAFAAGGIPEFVQHGLTGLIAETGDADQLAIRLEEMLSHQSRRREMAAAGRRLIESDYHLETQTQKYLDLYQYALASQNQHFGLRRRVA